jgi:hypothetical protein
MVVIYNGTENEILAKLKAAQEKARLEKDWHDQINPFFEDKDRIKVHKFLQKITLASAYGSESDILQFQAYAKGYIRAWTEFGGELKHPKPYVIKPKYGTGTFKVAYLVHQTMNEILEALDKEFPYMAVKATMNS